MFKRLHNENGYALFLSLLVILLFSLLTMLLLSVVVSGAKKNVIREHHVQAGELAEKGVEHLTSQIQKDLEDMVGEKGGIKRSLYLDEIQKYLNETHQCKQSVHTVESATGKYAVCIESWRHVNGDPDSLRKEVTINSRGYVDGKWKELKATILVGASDIPDALNYALGAHRSCSGNKDCIDGEGNLFLHGGAVIYGDMKVDGNIITSNRAHAILSDKSVWVDSLFPGVFPGPKSKEARLILGGDIYTFSRPPNSYDAHIKNNRFSSGIYKKANHINEAFENPPKVLKRIPAREAINITEKENSYKLDFHDPSVVKIQNTTIKNTNYSGKKVFPYRWNNRTDGNYTLEGDNTFGRFATDGNLIIINKENRFRTTNIEQGMYVKGNLEIGNKDIRDTDYNIGKYQKIRLNGPIYVNGNLTIKGADAEINSIIYVNGNVTIRNARINGLNVNGYDGSLIIFANQAINIANISVNQDEPSNIKGFFYSEDALEMYGVGSNIKIDGGISAKRIVLNAIRGRASDSHFHGAQYRGDKYFEGVNGQKSRQSRLQVVYNPDIIKTYSDMKEEEPYVEKIAPPRLVNRQ